VNDLRLLLQLLKNVALPVAILLVFLVYLWREYRATREKLAQLEAQLLREKYAEILKRLEEIQQDLSEIEFTLQKHREATE